MAEKSRQDLKSYFQSGKRPTGQQFADLIDSVINKLDDGIGVDGSNNVGVGTANPGAILDVKDQDGTIDIYRATDSTGQHRWRLDSGFDMFLTDNTGQDIVKIGQNGSWFNFGNIGVGTTNPSTRLHVIQNAVSDISGNEVTGSKWEIGRQKLTLKAIRTADETNWNSSTLKLQAIIDSTDHQSIDFVNDDNFQEHIDIYTGNQLFNTRFAENGNVGIGTDNPGSKLDVNGSLKFLSGAEQLLWSSKHVGNTDHRSYLAPRLADGSAWDWGQEFGYHNYYRAWYFDSNLGIGTSNPSEKLEINGSLVIAGANLDFNFKDLTYLKNSKSLLIGWNRSAGYGETNFITNRGPGSQGGFDFRDIDNLGDETLLMKIRGDGHVGIGTGNPEAKLNIHHSTILGSNANDEFLLGRMTQSAGNLSKLDFKHRRHTDGENWYGTHMRIQRVVDSTPQGFIDFGINNKAANYGLGLGSGSDTHMVIENNGNVGIGIVNPSARLHVIQSAVSDTTGDEITASKWEIGRQKLTLKALRTANETNWNSTTLKLQAIIDSTDHQSIDFVNDDNFQEHIDIYTGNQLFNTRFAANGNVGIGTDNPGSKLDVNGSLKFLSGAEQLLWSSKHVGDTDHRSYLAPKLPDGSTWDWGQEFGYHNYYRAWYFDGNLGIGTGNPTQKLHVIGDALKTAGGTAWQNPSDKRLKKNIKPFTDSLEMLKQVQPVTYRYNGKGGIQESGEEVGVIAQEIREVFPYMVSAYKARLNESDTDDSDILSFNGSALKFVMLNAIKEMDSTIGELRESNKNLHETNKKQKEINKKLEKRLARLELQSGL